MHLSQSLEPDSDGWYTARCNCGWRFGPLPDVETMVDALMEHAADMALTEGRLREVPDDAPTVTIELEDRGGYTVAVERGTDMVTPCHDDGPLWNIDPGIYMPGSPSGAIPMWRT